jgi:hypothetical protein
MLIDLILTSSWVSFVNSDSLFEVDMHTVDLFNRDLETL